MGDNMKEQKCGINFANYGLTAEEASIFSEVFGDIKHLFPPQEEAMRAGILKGGNFVISSPTASGKTLLAEFVMLKSILNGGRCLYVVPLNALAYEKFVEFRRRFSSVYAGDYDYYDHNGEALNSEAYVGDAVSDWDADDGGGRRSSGRKSGGMREAVSVGISTGDYESASRYLERYEIIVLTLEKFDSLTRLKPNWLRRITTVVIDEIHEVCDDRRGERLEGAIARFRMFNQHARIIALSATIPNADEFGKWLSANVVCSDWRPVPLCEDVLLARSDNTIIMSVLREVKDGGQVIVFVNTKRGAASFAQKIAERMTVQEELEAVADAVDMGIDNLADMVRRGVAYHTSWLHPEQRRLIEKAFRERKLKVICCTPTLAMGVSLPARVVIIRNYRFFTGLSAERMPVSWVKQVFGRAGRPEHDSLGMGLIVARSIEEMQEIFDFYINGEVERIESRFFMNEMGEQILATIVSGARRKKQLMDFVRNTLYAVQRSSEQIEERLDDILCELARYGLIEIENEIRATPFGTLVSHLYLNILSALRIRDGLRYLSAQHVSDFDLLLLLSDCEEVPKIYVKNALMTATNLTENIEWIYQCGESSVGTALLSHAWVDEMPYAEMKKRFNAYPGEIHAAVSTLEWLSYAASRMASHLGYGELASRLYLMKDRIRYGVRAELLDLVSLRGVGRVIARRLYTAGFRNAADIAHASEEELARIKDIGEKRAKIIKEQALKVSATAPQS